jgi:hypothetical protein
LSSYQEQFSSFPNFPKQIIKIKRRRISWKQGRIWKNVMEIIILCDKIFLNMQISCFQGKFMLTRDVSLMMYQTFFYGNSTCFFLGFVHLKFSELFFVNHSWESYFKSWKANHEIQEKILNTFQENLKKNFLEIHMFQKIGKIFCQMCTLDLESVSIIKCEC